MYWEILKIIFALLLAAYVIGSVCTFFYTIVVYAIFHELFGWEYVHFFSYSCTLKLLNDCWVLIHQHIFHLYISVLHWASCYKTVKFHVCCMYMLYCTVFLHPIPTLSLIHLLVLNLLPWPLHWLSHSVMLIFKMIKPALLHVQFSFHDHFTDFSSCTFEIGLVIGKPAHLCTLILWRQSFF
jgi:hypothetical protein